MLGGYKYAAFVSRVKRRTPILRETLPSGSLTGLRIAAIGVSVEQSADPSRLFRIAAFWNYTAAAAFCLPSSVLSLFGMPTPVPSLYPQMAAALVATFGLGYHLVARNVTRNHGIVVIGAIGKTGLFALFLAYYLAGRLPVLPLVIVFGDLVFAALFVRFLLMQHRARVSAVTESRDQRAGSRSG